MNLSTRRQALRTFFAAAAVLAGGASLLDRAAAQTNMPAPVAPPTPTGPYTLPPLPYAYDALAPYIDAETMHLHHDKHHAAYVAKLNEAVAPYPELGKKPVDQLLRDFASVPPAIQKAVRNQGGGHANHSLFWTILGKNGGAKPGGALAQAIDRDLGGLEKFEADFSKEALGVFGSGWTWVVIAPSSQKLELVSTPNQDSPLLTGQTPLFGIDVWEHAYYLNYKNRRAEYVKAFWNVLNWDAIAARHATLTA